jgi:hypothetical protein
LKHSKAGGKELAFGERKYRVRESSVSRVGPSLRGVVYWFLSAPGPKAQDRHEKSLRLLSTGTETSPGGSGRTNPSRPLSSLRIRKDDHQPSIQDVEGASRRRRGFDGRNNPVEPAPAFLLITPSRERPPEFRSRSPRISDQKITWSTTLPLLTQFGTRDASKKNYFNTTWCSFLCA